jgi:hypothetical protein
MAEEDLVRVIRWLKADRRPCYALLPIDEYSSRWQAWNLPPPGQQTAQR